MVMNGAERIESGTRARWMLIGFPSIVNLFMQMNNAPWGAVRTCAPAGVHVTQHNLLEVVFDA